MYRVYHQIINDGFIGIYMGFSYQLGMIVGLFENDIYHQNESNLHSFCRGLFFHQRMEWGAPFISWMRIEDPAVLGSHLLIHQECVFFVGMLPSGND